MSQKRGVLVVSAFANFAMNALRCLDSAGFKGYVMGAGAMPEVMLSRFCAGYLRSSLEDFRAAGDRVVDGINAYCAKNRIVMVVPCDIVTTLMLSAIRSRISPASVFPISATETLELLHNKWTFAQFLRQNGLPTPRTALLKDADAPLSPEVRFPVFVKPLDQGDSIGVRKIDSQDELRRYLAEGSHPPPLQLQEFIPGMDGSLNLLAKKGEVLAWSMQRNIDDGMIEFFEDETLLAMGRTIARASSYEGLGNFNLRFDSRDGRYWFTECNPRLWGSLRAAFWNGTNFVEAGIRLGLGEALPSSVNRRITYMRPQKLLERLKKGRFSELAKMPRASYQDLGQLWSDPLSSAFMTCGKLFKKG